MANFYISYLVSLVFNHVQLWTHCNYFGFLCRWWHSSYSQTSHWRYELKSASSSLTWNNFFSFNNFLNAHCIVKVTNTELWDINQLMGNRDAQWYIKDTWIGFSMINITKQAVVHHTSLASQTMGCWNGETTACSSWMLLKRKLLIGHRHGR